MASTNFIDNQTVIYASWLNDINDAIYNGNFPALTNTFDTIDATNITATNANFTNLVYSAAQIDFGNNFIMYSSGTKLYVKYNGVNVVSIDSTGIITSLSNITGATP